MSLQDKRALADDIKMLASFKNDTAIETLRRLLMNRMDKHYLTLYKLSDVDILSAPKAAPYLFRMKECQEILDLINGTRVVEK